MNEAESVISELVSNAKSDVLHEVMLHMKREGIDVYRVKESRLNAKLYNAIHGAMVISTVMDGKDKWAVFDDGFDEAFDEAYYALLDVFRKNGSEDRKGLSWSYSKTDKEYLFLLEPDYDDFDPYDE